jgi:hypothetical protein
MWQAAQALRRREDPADAVWGRAPPTPMARRGDGNSCPMSPGRWNWT